MKRFTVLLFARLKELVGAASVEIDLPAGATIADLRRRLADERPQTATLLPHCLFAVDDAYAAESHVLNDGDEIACIPPVSGG
jgi:molybdopterin converting factor subunit 1